MTDFDLKEGVHYVRSSTAKKPATGKPKRCIITDTRLSRAAIYRVTVMNNVLIAYGIGLRAWQKRTPETLKDAEERLKKAISGGSSGSGGSGKADSK